MAVDQTLTVGSPLTAVVLAAGLGTRLRPLSHQVPKPLFPILNRPLLGLILTQLEAAGFKRVAINTHHRAADLNLFVESQGPWNLEVFLSHEPVILGTGGGLRQLADFLGESPFLVINGDILTDLDLAAVSRTHPPDALATMILHDYPRFNNVWLDNSQRIIAFGAAPAGISATAPLAYTGIQVVSPRIFSFLLPGKAVSIIDTYRQAIARGEQVIAAVRHGFYWQDIGTPQDYLEIHRRLLAGEMPGVAALYPPIADPYLAPGVTLGAGARLESGVCLGTGVQVGPDVYLKNTVVWADAVLEAGVRLEDCVVGQGVQVRESAQGRCLVA
jgi:mannose-1-phosphate guanylyltransferase